MIQVGGHALSVETGRSEAQSAYWSSREFTELPRAPGRWRRCFRLGYHRLRLARRPREQFQVDHDLAGSDKLARSPEYGS